MGQLSICRLRCGSCQRVTFGSGVLRCWRRQGAGAPSQSGCSSAAMPQAQGVKLACRRMLLGLKPSGAGPAHLRLGRQPPTLDRACSSRNRRVSGQESVSPVLKPNRRDPHATGMKGHVRCCLHFCFEESWSFFWQAYAPVGSRKGAIESRRDLTEAILLRRGAAWCIKPILPLALAPW